MTPNGFLIQDLTIEDPTVKQLLAQEKLAKEAPLNAEFTEAEAQPTVTETEDDNTTSSAE